MKLHLFLYLLGIIKDIKGISTANSLVLNNIKYSKFLQYNSELIGKIGLSVEMFYEIFNKSGDIDELFDKKKYFLLATELIKLGFKFKELKFLNDSGFNFYFSKQIYFDHVLHMSDEDYFSKLEEVK